MSLDIKWQRLVVDGDTCERCGMTEEEVDKAFQKLKNSLEPLGIDVCLEKEVLDKEEFEEDPRSSNTVYINDKALEEWVDAEVSESECCDVCGDEDCRTLVLDGEEYEVVPSELVIEAGLEAVSGSVDSGCCGSSSGSDSCCS